MNGENLKKLSSLVFDTKTVFSTPAPEIPSLSGTTSGNNNLVNLNSNLNNTASQIAAINNNDINSYISVVEHLSSQLVALMNSVQGISKETTQLYLHHVGQSRHTAGSNADVNTLNPMDSPFSFDNHLNQNGGQQGTDFVGGNKAELAKLEQLNALRSEILELHALFKELSVSLTSSNKTNIMTKLHFLCACAQEMEQKVAQFNTEITKI